MFELMNAHQFEINTNPGGVETFAPIAVGVTNVEPGTNEELSQDKYLDGNGYGETDVIGAQLVLSFTGHRNYGDPAQDFIFSKMLGLGASRRTNFRWTEPNGGVFTGNCTIANISAPSGDAGAKGEVSWEIHFNGEPIYTPPSGDTIPPTVTVVPDDAATAVAVSANVVWTFSEPIQDGSVNDANFFVTSAEGVPVAGTLSIDTGKTIVTFNPTANLTAATPYVAIATRNIKDVAGNAMAANSVTNFTTA